MVVPVMPLSKYWYANIPDTSISSTNNCSNLVYFEEILGKGLRIVEEALAIRSLFIYMNKKISQMHED